MIGPGHVALGKPNQDCWSSFHRSFCDGIVVSDGLGSKAHSHIGSAAACAAVERATFSAWLDDEESIDEGFLEKVGNYWLEGIAPFESKNASATCLFAISYRGLLWLGMLGDGAAAAVKSNGDVILLEDDKSTSFSNLTDSLSGAASTDNWRLACVPEDECFAAVLCTDGISDDIVGQDNMRNFMKSFAQTASSMSLIWAAKEAKEMLEEWPTPKHTDDKTIACLLRRELRDG